MTGKRDTSRERFERHYMPVTECGCWIWLGCLNDKGYGLFYVGQPVNARERAHRCSYVIHKGPLPRGLDVRHTCDMPACVNPDHLVLGTRQQNMHDAIGRGRMARGFALPQTKLSVEQVSAIRIDSRSSYAIAREYDVSARYIRKIKDNTKRAP